MGVRGEKKRNEIGYQEERQRQGEGKEPLMLFKGVTRIKNDTIGRRGKKKRGSSTTEKGGSQGKESPVTSTKEEKGRKRKGPFKREKNSLTLITKICGGV